MPRPNPEHVARLRELIAASPYPSLLSMRLADIGAGFAELVVDVERKHMQLLGVVHGGVLAALIDTAAFWAVYFGIPGAGDWYASVDLKLNFLAPAFAGSLVARGRQVKVGKKLCYATARIHDEQGTIVAHGASTLMILPNKLRLEDFPLPPKFID